MEGALNQLVKNTSSHSIFPIFASGQGGTITTTFEQPIILPDNHKYSIALTSLFTWFSWANIKPGNSTFTYFDKVEWRSFILPTGIYDILDINTKINELLEIKDSIVLYGDPTTLKAVLVIKPDFKVKFPNTGGLAKLLGFKPGIYNSGKHTGLDIVEISSENTILVECDLIGTSFVNGRRHNVIHVFNVNTLPGTRISVVPNVHTYYPLAFNVIERFTITLTDQNSIPLDLRSEYLSVSFDIRQT